MIVHLTDGEPTDGDPEPYAEAIKSLATEDGELLLFNCHLSTSSASPVVFPVSESMLTDDYAKLLFRISSELPDSLRGPLATGEQGGQLPAGGARDGLQRRRRDDDPTLIQLGTVAGGAVHRARWPTCVDNGPANPQMRRRPSMSSPSTTESAPDAGPDEVRAGPRAGPWADRRAPPVALTVRLKPTVFRQSRGRHAAHRPGGEADVDVDTEPIPPPRPPSGPPTGARTRTQAPPGPPRFEVRSLWTRSGATTKPMGGRLRTTTPPA